jgi:death-on-curing protein
MRKCVSVNRLAKSAGVDPEAVVLRLIERGVEIDDPEGDLEGDMRKAARAVIREMKGGPVIVRQREGVPAPCIEPAPQSPALTGMLSVEDVVYIHERLCAEFAAGPDPIDPPGVRSDHLLGSAVGRQHSGVGDLLKYHDPVLNAATLLFGICNDHPFFNGNKRTALVSTLAHLDTNQFVLQATTQNELFRLMIAVANHAIVTNQVKIGRETSAIPRKGTPDEEVEAITSWLRPRLEKIGRGERQITYRELRQILGRFGFQLIPAGAGGKANVVRTESGGLLKRPRSKTVMSIKWPGEGRPVTINEIKHIRRTLKLCEEDGVDRDTFYERGVRVDKFINEHRTVLRRLASR